MYCTVIFDIIQYIRENVHDKNSVIFFFLRCTNRIKNEQIDSVHRAERGIRRILHRCNLPASLIVLKKKQKKRIAFCHSFFAGSQTATTKIAKEEDKKNNNESVFIDGNPGRTAFYFHRG